MDPSAPNPEILDVQLTGMHATRRRILESLKLRGPQTAASLGEELGITRMGVRQHLTALERDRLIAFRTESRGLGRSSHVYSLTSRGDELFPRSYRDLATGLLDALRHREGGIGVEGAFAARNERLAPEYAARLAGLADGERVEALARVRTDEGYMAESEPLPDGGFRLREHNCAIFGVAKRCEEACSAEIDLFRGVLPGATIVREQHLLRGDACCSYRIAFDD